RPFAALPGPLPADRRDEPLSVRARRRDRARLLLLGGADRAPPSTGQRAGPRPHRPLGPRPVRPGRPEAPLRRGALGGGGPTADRRAARADVPPQRRPAQRRAPARRPRRGLPRRRGRLRLAAAHDRPAAPVGAGAPPHLASRAYRRRPRGARRDQARGSGASAVVSGARSGGRAAEELT